MTGQPTTSNGTSPDRATVPRVAARTQDASWISEQVRANIRVLKSVRHVSDVRIAELAGYSSRQAFSARMSGRTEFTPEDFARVAAALRVEPFVLLLKMDEALRWAEDNPNFKPPKYRKQPKQLNKVRKSS